MYRTRNLLSFLKKSWNYSTTPPQLANVIEQLTDRALLQVSGPEAGEYLQGLITNDVQHIRHGGCMYSMFLNTKGRVLYDVIIYRTEEVDAYLIECDVEAIAPLEKHLKIYKLRRKLDIKSLLQDYKVFTMFDPELVRSNTDFTMCDVVKETTTSTVRTHKNLLIFRDPRVSLLGFRVISPKDSNVKTDLSDIYEIQSNSDVIPVNYRWARYTLGIGEGVRDLPPGNCFPLEANGDYLHGVSFQKGCYIGQELTARTHHTGVVRKRLMPLLFRQVPGKMPENDIIMNEGVNLGKLRGIDGDAGLALFRVTKALDFAEIAIGNGVARTLRPSWWPIEASKEKILQQNE